jgi:hypothetical protein
MISVASTDAFLAGFGHLDQRKRLSPGTSQGLIHIVGDPHVHPAHFIVSQVHVAQQPNHWQVGGLRRVEPESPCSPPR